MSFDSGAVCNSVEFELEDAFADNESRFISWSVESLVDFMSFNEAQSRKLTIVTSGGTAVALEQNAVRFLDNFSTGSRGSACTEALLTTRGDYAVIFLGRRNAKMPFTRHLVEAAAASAPAFERRGGGRQDEVILRDSKAASAVGNLRDALQSRRLHVIEFTTVQEYLFSLRCISMQVRHFHFDVMYILAAAVSDFYIPENRMSEHKLQSSDGGIILELDRVPKCLGLLTKRWAPRAFVVSFKLETKESILIEKSIRALSTYGVNMVVANLLHSRYDVVRLVRRASAIAEGNREDHEPVTDSAFEVNILHKQQLDDIEHSLMDELVKAHSVYSRRLSDEDVCVV